MDFSRLNSQVKGRLKITHFITFIYFKIYVIKFFSHKDEREC